MAVEVALMVAAAHAAVRAQVARINDLNVYPVPDGDTGTNMLLTIESTLNETEGKTYASAEEASKAVARAALMGARGNSGVILSQMIRGASEALAGNSALDAETFASGLEGARERAYSSVREPVEGTMLTVVKDAALAARESVEEGTDLISAAQAARRAAHESVRRTPELLPVLREAGVVDAGGLGVAVILDGVYACVADQEIEVPEEAGDGMPDLEAIHAREEAWGYCTEFLVDGFEGDTEEFGEHVYASGRSVFVVADDDMVKVHLHTQDPGQVLTYAGRFGRLAGVKVDDMEAQVRSREAEPAGRPANVGVVVASRGAGNRALFEQMGAVVIEGGQGENPSAADLARAVDRTGAPVVIVLPNNKNIVPTAEQVGDLVEAETRVVPTTSIASGLAVMVGYDSEGEPDDVVEEMAEICAALRAAEITVSVRDARIGDREVPEGSYIGFLSGELIAVEETVEGAALVLAKKMVGEGVDFLTLLKGEDLTGDDLEEIVAGIEELDEELEVEIRDGGQPLYPVQMVAE